MQFGRTATMKGACAPLDSLPTNPALRAFESGGLLDGVGWFSALVFKGLSLHIKDNALSSFNMVKCKSSPNNASSVNISISSLKLRRGRVLTGPWRRHAFREKPGRGLLQVSAASQGSREELLKQVELYPFLSDTPP